MNTKACPSSCFVSSLFSSSSSTSSSLHRLFLFNHLIFFHRLAKTIQLTFFLLSLPVGNLNEPQNLQPSPPQPSTSSHVSTPDSPCLQLSCTSSTKLSEAVSLSHCFLFVCCSHCSWLIKPVSVKCCERPQTIWFSRAQLSFDSRLHYSHCHVISGPALNKHSQGQPNEGQGSWSCSRKGNPVHQE